jgi:hypothetical protein
MDQIVEEFLKTKYMLKRITELRTICLDACKKDQIVEEFLKTKYMLKRITELRTISLDASKMDQIVKGSFDLLFPSYI